MIKDETFEKYKSKKLPWLLQEAQKRVNKFVRLRDTEGDYFKCISCQEYKHTSEATAGHFLSVGEFSALRFDLDNNFAQCYVCNNFKNGNGKEYVIHLKNRIGIERYEKLITGAKRTHKWDRFELIELIDRYKDYS